MRAGGRMLAKPPSMLRTGARLAGEPNEPSAPKDLATERVKPDAARLQDGGLRRPAPAVQRSKPRDDAHLELLTQPYELYRHASDQTRRMLNQAIFKHIYVVNEEVIGDELNTPMRELLSAQRGWSVFEDTGDDVLARELAGAEAQRHSDTSQTKQATVSGGLLDDFNSALLTDRVETVGICSKPSMVRLKGLEPLTF